MNHKVEVSNFEYPGIAVSQLKVGEFGVDSRGTVYIGIWTLPSERGPNGGRRTVRLRSGTTLIPSAAMTTVSRLGIGTKITIEVM